jgi:putative transposase
LLLSIPPHLALLTVMQRIKGRSSRRIQMEFPELRKRYWRRRFWGRRYFSTTSGNVTDDVILQYLDRHFERNPTGIRWDGCRLPQMATKMCQCGVLKLTLRKGRQDERYYDRGGFSKERVSGSWGLGDGAGQVSKEDFSTAVP